ncbi:MAG: hypothetical protein WCQ53_07945 [bacterium]
MLIKDLLPGRAEMLVLLILLSLIFCYEIASAIRKMWTLLIKITR